MNKILQILSPRKSTELPCIVRVTKDNVRMNLLQYSLPCGHDGYRIDLEFFIEGTGWIEIASLRDFNLDAAIDVLNEAKVCIGNLEQQ